MTTSAETATPTRTTPDLVAALRDALDACRHTIHCHPDDADRISAAVAEVARTGALAPVPAVAPSHAMPPGVVYVVSPTARALLHDLVPDLPRDLGGAL